MALDYGMALSRGLIAPQKQLQDEVKKLAGDQFKTVDWWNKQLDRQIKEGYSATRNVTDKITTDTTTFTNNQKYQVANPKYNPLDLDYPELPATDPLNSTSFGVHLGDGSGGMFAQAGGQGQLIEYLTGIQKREQANNPRYLYGDQPEFLENKTSKVTYNTRQVTGKGPLTDAELKAIQSQAEEQTRQAKRKTADLGKGTRQKRGATGLMGRSEVNKVGLASELPQLGFDGLGIQKTFLG